MEAPWVHLHLYIFLVVPLHASWNFYQLRNEALKLFYSFQKMLYYWWRHGKIIQYSVLCGILYEEIVIMLIIMLRREFSPIDKWLMLQSQSHCLVCVHNYAWQKYIIFYKQTYQLLISTIPKQIPVYCRLLIQKYYK